MTYLVFEKKKCKKNNIFSYIWISLSKEKKNQGNKIKLKNYIYILI